MVETTLRNCPHCGSALAPAALLCPACGQRVYQARLIQLIGDAQRLESVDRFMAAGVWRQCLALLPPESADYQQIATRATTLGGVAYGTPPRAVAPIELGYEQRPEQQESLATALFKTGGSMALS